MKTLLISCTYFMVFIHSVTYAQEENNPNKSDERINVNKEYDNNGNLIRYDSTYSYSSSNSGIKTKDMDSIFKNFFSKSASSFFNDSFEFDNSIFLNHNNDMDSLFSNRMKNHKSFFDDFLDFNRRKREKDSTATKNKM